MSQLTLSRGVDRLRFCSLEAQQNLSESATAPAPTVRRPIAVTFVAVLAFVVGIYHVVYGVVVLVNGGDSSRLAEGAFDLVLGVFAVAIGRGALRMTRWAWAAFMAWAVIGLTHQLLRHFFYADTNYLAMALDTVAVMALTPLDVQVDFGVRHPRHPILERAARTPVDGS